MQAPLPQAMAHRKGGVAYSAIFREADTAPPETGVNRGRLRAGSDQQRPPPDNRGGSCRGRGQQVGHDLAYSEAGLRCHYPANLPAGSES